MPFVDTLYWTLAWTIAVTRLVLWIRPTPSPTLRGFRLHHWMTGLALAAAAVAFSAPLLFAIGLGLFLDELTYLVIGGKSHADNYSPASLWGTALVLLLAHAHRHLLFSFFA